MTTTLINGVTQTLEAALTMASELFPKLLGMLVIVAVGWFIAAIIKLLVRYILRLFKFDEFCNSVGATQVLTKAELPPPSELAGRVAFWVNWIAFLMLGISTLGFVVLEDQISQFFLYLPQFFVAIIILFVGIIFANFSARAVLLGMVNANIPSARLTSNATRAFLIILTIAMALEQVALAKSVVLIAFSIAFGALMFGFAIAFGLGGRDVAKRILEQQFSDEVKSEKDEISHL